MDIATNKLASDFRAQVRIHPGHDEFFRGLVSIAAGKPIDEKLGESIKEYVLGYVGCNPLSIDNFTDTGYVRNYIGRDLNSGWEAIVMSWKRGNRTAIHSHPRFASYTIADGKFLIEIFEPAGVGKARLKEALVVYDSQSFYAIGKTPDFLNHIHRITCLSDTGHSLHVYSDDALKGYKFELAIE
ncbi:MAG: cysteine dioxygenase [Rikenellaceae bacterium]|nr:cysteine dioxygenase [Rikenellaceae bacterium]